MDRRSFLHSYDPSSDPEGRILARIFSQVIPVCGGINLEYYFSRIDNSIYGAGTNSCQHWTESRQKGEGWVTSGQWLLGFVSAANVYATSPPSDTDSRAIAGWVDNYCGSHPDVDLSDAVQELVHFLMAGARP